MTALRMDWIGVGLILTVVLVHTGNDVVDEEQDVFDDGLLVCGQSAVHVAQTAHGVLLDTSGNSLSGSHVLCVEKCVLTIFMFALRTISDLRWPRIP